MRTTPEEYARLGASIARKRSAATAPVAILLPGRGVPAIDKEEQPFYDPGARRARRDAIRSGVLGIELAEVVARQRPARRGRGGSKVLQLMRMDSTGGTA